jgi:DNA-binding response OmpR family regulator
MTTAVEAANILVVDDEGPNRYSVCKTLQRVGYNVLEAASGEEALEVMEHQNFDVVLTDIRMPPGLDGVELLRRIRAQAPDSIVILMTGFASLTTAVEALRLGAHDYLIKPSSSQDIRQSVSRGVERAHSLRRRRGLLESIRNEVFELAHAEPTTPSSNNVLKAEYQNGDNGRYAEVNGNNADVTNGTSMQLGPLTVYPGRYRGRVVPCSELVREVRGYAVDEAEAREVIRPHVSNLRRKLKSSGPNADLIVNVRGIGYRLSDRAK